jgi:hypothetical protein
MLFLLNSDGVPSVARWVRLVPGAPDRPQLSADGAGPTVEVRPTSRGGRLRSKGKLVLSVAVDEPASVDLEVRLKGAAPTGLASKRKSLELGAGARTVVVKFARSARRGLKAKPRVLVGVDARDAAGNQTTWSRTLRLKR